MSVEVEKALTARFEALFEGLSPEETRPLFESLMDWYTDSVYGLSVIDEIKKIKKDHTTTTIQAITDNAILVSDHGYKVVSVTQNPKGGRQVILREVTRKEFEKDRYRG